MAEPTNVIKLPELKMKSLQASKATPILGLIASSKEGKTTASLTASEKCDITFSKPQVLDDIGIITYDNDPMAGARAMGVDVPYWFDMAEHAEIGLASFEKLNEEALNEMKKLAVSGKIRALIVDPMSTLDQIWKAYLTKNYEKWALIDQLLMRHRRFLMGILMSIPIPKILTFHTRTVSNVMTEDKKNAGGLDASDKLVLDISGWDAPSLYRKQMTQYMPVKRHTKPGQKPGFKLHPNGIDGIESGGRIPAFDTIKEMPVDMSEVLRIVNGENPAQKAG